MSFSLTVSLVIQKTTKNQPREHNYTQQAPKAISHSVNFFVKKKPQIDRTEKFPFFQQNKTQLANNL